MMPSNYAINGLTAPDPPTATAASTLVVGVFVDHFNLDVVNQAIFWQLQGPPLPSDPPQMASWQSFVPVLMLPGSRTIARQGVTGIRFWAAIKLSAIPAGSQQAVVTVEAVV